MAKLKIRIVDHKIGKITGSQGQFGRSDDWGVIQFYKIILPNGLETILTNRKTLSRHDSREAAQRALDKIKAKQ